MEDQNVSSTMASEIIRNDNENFAGSKQACNNLITENNKEQSIVIKRINGETVNKICSGQVILNLSIAVKELIENAIDAGATNIQIKVKEYGCELIEVIDNGCGVLEQNFAGLTLKHYTSKLKEFADLESVGTLGFRGEALSSLCAISNVTITTKHPSATVGTKIEYDHNGTVIKQIVASRSEGTTVSISNVFSTLPVRRKQLVKNLKREFGKMCQLLYAYCLVSVNIKITCTNLTNKNSETTIMATQGSSSVRDNIVNIFGAKQISSLVDIQVREPTEKILEEYSLKMIPNKRIPFSFEGFISSVMHGSGRSTSDRQFYYINSRPCEPTKVMKLVNEIYKQFNTNQYPFVYLNILIDKKHIDVNVTPDKRQIFLDNEKLVLAVLKSSLLDIFKDFPSTYTMQNLNITQFKEETSLEKTSKGLKRFISQDKGSHLKTSLLDCYRKKLKKSEDTEEHSTNLLKTDTNKTIVVKDDHKCENLPKATDANITQDVIDTASKDFESKIGNKDLLVCKYTKKAENVILDKTSQSRISNKLDAFAVKSCRNEKTDESLMGDSTKSMKEEKQGQQHMKSNIILNISLNIIEQNIHKKKNRDMESKTNRLVNFRFKINRECNAQAEQELQKQISKNKFKEMKIVGQFNLGFIIARLESDLFIIDQHAADEKYNFEQLQMNTILETQALIIPKELHLTAANEGLLIENENMFKKNGFVFCIDHAAAPTKKVKLTAMPVSKNYSFEKEDIDELLFMLQEGCDTMCRPSRMRKMFASRACRKSVMVGKALTENHMRKIIDHMGEIDQPWNCPHGRPTMRHLINLNLIQEM